TILYADTATTTTQHQLKLRKHLNDKNLLQGGMKIIDHYNLSLLLGASGILRCPTVSLEGVQ
ncbi:hypothetical protein, partial [Sessilibacter sp. MAH4]